MTRSKIRTSGAEGLTLSSTSLTVADGLTLTDGDIALASGHGIDFSATANSSGTMVAELFDDYEEGTWVPTAGTNAGSFDSGTKKGRYTKIGDMVFILAFFQFTGASTSDNRTMGGLPFPIQDVSGLTGVDYFGHSWNGNHYGLVHFSGGGTEFVDNYSAILAGSFASSGTTRLYGWYKTSS